MLFKPFPQNLLSISLSLPEVSNSRDVGCDLRIEDINNSNKKASKRWGLERREMESILAVEWKEFFMKHPERRHPRETKNSYGSA